MTTNVECKKCGHPLRRHKKTEYLVGEKTHSMHKCSIEGCLCSTLDNEYVEPLTVKELMIKLLDCSMTDEIVVRDKNGKLLKDVIIQARHNNRNVGILVA